MTSINVQFIRKSSNAKIGKIPATNTARKSCPASCPLAGKGGCYAEAGFYTRLNWDKIDSGERGGDWSQLCDSIAKLPEGQLWRHNVSGDLPHVDEVIDFGALSDLLEANEGKRGFTYTHHDMKRAANRKAVRLANKLGFTVNLSGNNPAHADELAALNIAPVVTVVPADQVENTTTPEGRKIVICPAAIRDDVSCETCQLCQRSNRSVIIGFPAHGSRKAAAASA